MFPKFDNSMIPGMLPGWWVWIFTWPQEQGHSVLHLQLTFSPRLSAALAAWLHLWGQLWKTLQTRQDVGKQRGLRDFKAKERPFTPCMQAFQTLFPCVCACMGTTRMPEDYTLFSQTDCRRKILRSVQGKGEEDLLVLALHSVSQNNEKSQQNLMGVTPQWVIKWVCKISLCLINPNNHDRTTLCNFPTIAFHWQSSRVLDTAKKCRQFYALPISGWETEAQRS